MVEYLDSFEWSHSAGNHSRKWHMWAEYDKEGNLHELFIGISSNLICARPVCINKPQGELEKHAVKLAQEWIVEALVGDQCEVIDFNDFQKGG